MYPKAKEHSRSTEKSAQLSTASETIEIVGGFVKPSRVKFFTRGISPLLYACTVMSYFSPGIRSVNTVCTVEELKTNSSLITHGF